LELSTLQSAKLNPNEFRDAINFFNTTLSSAKYGGKYGHFHQSNS